MERLANLIYFAILLIASYFLFPYFLPFLLALVVSSLLEPIVLWLMNRFSLPRPIAITFTYILTIVSFIVTLTFSIGYLVKELISFAKSFPDTLKSWLSQDHLFYEYYQSIPNAQKEILQDTVVQYVTSLPDNISSITNNLYLFVAQFPGYFISLIVFLVSFFLIGFQYNRLSEGFLKMFEEGETRKHISHVVLKLKQAVIGFLQAQTIILLVISVVTLFFLGIWGYSYVFFLTILIVVVDLLPILGAGSILVPWSVLLLMTNDINGAIGAIVLFVLLTIIRRIMETKLVANSLGISPLLTLISMFVGFAILGFVGLILGPVAVIIVKTLHEEGVINWRIQLFSSQKKKSS